MVEAQAVAEALRAATSNTVALKLPEFSPDRIEYWFIAVEAEFNLVFLPLPRTRPGIAM